MARRVRRASRTSDMLAIVLAGGQGERLYPLTRDRAKPAVPFGSAYRLIDFTLSNCVNSGIRRVHVLTQYKSDSLYRHMRLAWDIFNPELGEFIEVNPPQLRLTSHWYLGTADAIYQNIYTLERERPEHVIVLSGDHVYKMDYRALIAQHTGTDADLTMACVPTALAEASRLGCIGVADDMRALNFQEKPERPCPMAGWDDVALCSMGVYVFRTEALVRRVIEDSKAATSHDFGRDVIPAMIREDDRVFAYPFAGADEGRAPYWRDIGTLDAYWRAHMDLVEEPPPFELHAPGWLIRTNAGYAPPAVLDVGGAGESGVPSEMRSSLLANGCQVRRACIHRCVLGREVHVGEGSEVRESVILNGVRIGRGCVVRRAIIDKENVVPDGYRIGVDPRQDAHHFAVSEGGIVVVPKRMPLFRP